jgi:uncharacterized membrane protein YfcA
VLFTAASVQAAGGMGFGLIAGPVMIATLGSSVGIQAAVMLNLMVALVACMVGRNIRFDLLLPMVPGVLMGMLVGLVASLIVPELAMKTILCLTLGWICLPARRTGEEVKLHTLKFAMTSGVMGGALAIPGPAAAIYLRSVISNTQAFRSSMMPLLVFVYLGIDAAAIEVSLTSGPAAIAGLLFGILVSRWISDEALKRLTQGILIATLLSLVITTTKDLIALAT